MIIELAVSKLKEVFNKKGYKFFENGNYNLNIIGVRCENTIPNSFDDFLMCVYKVNNEWVCKDYTITTDAGLYWLENPMVSEKGCALLVPNQYRGVYKLDKHKGEYTALCQRNGKVDVYRDNDRDRILDYNESTIDSGYFGINIHRSHPNKVRENVGKYSAGCQVFQNPKEFDEFIEICKKQSEMYSNSFSYTLLKIKDLEI